MFKNLLSGGDKLWAIGEHRVKEKKVMTPTETQQTPHGAEPGYKTKYKCIDCHKKFDERETFKNEECYEVIE